MTVEAKLREGTEVLRTGGGVSLSAGECSDLLEERARWHAGLRELAGTDPHGMDGYHVVGDERPEEARTCPGCIARRALQELLPMDAE